MAENDRSDEVTRQSGDASPDERDIDDTAYGVGPEGSNGATARGMSREEYSVGTGLDQGAQPAPDHTDPPEG